MEVHHHPDLHHKQKHFKEYLLEFLMIFLAVTLGFFAESIREEINNHSREREYMHSLITDLQADTTSINEAMIRNLKIYGKDSAFLKSLGKARTDSNDFKNTFMNYGETEVFIHPNNDSKTFDEMKSTGDIRLVRNENVFFGIAKYYQMASIVKDQGDELQRDLERNYNLAYKIFDLYSFRNNYPSWQEAFKERGKLISDNEDLMKEYRSGLYKLSRDFVGYDSVYLTNEKREAAQLIELIRKEYRFKN